MYMEEYKRWSAMNLEDTDLTDELKEITQDEDAIKDRFAINLSFGTAGLRGVLGAGTNRMNIYTVRKATQGLANHLLEKGGQPSVAISYDSRIKSDLFSVEAAKVLAANGIKVYIYPVLQPVPILSFAVRRLKADAGIMITASHNPAKYNGYKVYGSDGCQMPTEAANAVLAQIEKIDIFNDVKTVVYEKAKEEKLIEDISDDVVNEYYENVKKQSINPELGKTSGLKLVYSPLNGAGNVPVRHILKEIGINDVIIVKEQENPDGNFPTCPYPNPEVKETLSLGLELAKQTGADLMLATDPDADRVGIAVRDEAGEYHLLTGNEVGVLLLDYISRERKEKGTMPENPLFVKSIVSTPMAKVVGDKYGVECVDVLTGFKFIGEQIKMLEDNGEEQRFIFGFEESYGYLAGTYVRDKDAVVASMLICEMAAWYKTQGMSLYEGLNELYREFGTYTGVIESFEFEGLSGMDKMQGIMQGLRENDCPENFAGIKVLKYSDFIAKTCTDLQTGNVSEINLPESDILSYNMEDGMGIIIRPSGTEPKIKVYYTTKGKTKADALNVQKELSKVIAPIFK